MKNIKIEIMKTMCYFFSVFLLLPVFSDPVFSQDALKSKWYQPENIVFPDSYLFDTDNEVFYHLANDGENLYIYLVMVSDASQIKALRYGLTIYIDPVAKNRKNSWIKLLTSEPDQQSFFPDRQVSPADREAARIQRRQAMLSQVVNAEISGFGMKKSVIPISELKDITCRIHLDDQVKLNIIYAIPLSLIDNDKPLNNFSFGIETGSLNMDQMQVGRPGMGAGGGRPQGAPGERPAGMRPGGGERPGAERSPEEIKERRASMQKLMVPVKVWVKSVSLAETEN